MTHRSISCQIARRAEKHQNSIIEKISRSLDIMKNDQTETYKMFNAHKEDKKTK